MKIAFDYQIFSQQKYGGISRYFCSLTNALSQLKGVDAKIFAPVHINSYLSDLPSAVVSGKKVPSIKKTTFLRESVNRFFSAPLINRFHPDVVHETYYSNLISASGACPIIITVHDMIHELFPEDLEGDDETIDLKREAIKRADHVICVSKNTKLDMMRLYGTHENKISTVYHGIDNFSVGANLRSVEQQVGKPFILYVGKREGYKNFSTLLKAVASSKSLLSEVNIIAFGGVRFLESELREISILGFAEGQVTHRVGNDDMLGSLYASAKIFVYPSLYEGFGIPPLEAMAHGCPVACSNTSSLPEVVGDAAELFNPMDATQICAAIENIVFSSQRAQLLIERGYERAKQFSWEKCAQETLDVYQKVCR